MRCGLRVLVYEFITGGGWYSQGNELPPASLIDEGLAMVRALASDFAAIEGTSVDVLRDVRFRTFELPGTVHRVSNLADERRALARLSALADWTVLIAPEFNERLLTRTRAIERAGRRLLGPSSQAVALATDKQATAVHLKRHGLPVPPGVALAAGEPMPQVFDYPAVLKPRDGAGSQGLRYIPRAGQGVAPWPARLEQYCPGQPASVAVLCGPDLAVPLAPCRQRLAGDKEFAYLGGSLPLDAIAARRAQRLATRAVQSLPGVRGWLGVDLVMGDDPAGSGDRIFEINPRLTTSYVGLRALSQVNLAAAMVAVAQGEPVELCWKESEVSFTSRGEISIAAVPGGE